MCRRRGSFLHSYDFMSRETDNVNEPEKNLNTHQGPIFSVEFVPLPRSPFLSTNLFQFNMYLASFTINSIPHSHIHLFIYLKNIN